LPNSRTTLTAPISIIFPIITIAQVRPGSKDRPLATCACARKFPFPIPGTPLPERLRKRAPAATSCCTSPVCRSHWPFSRGHPPIENHPGEARPRREPTITREPAYSVTCGLAIPVRPTAITASVRVLTATSFEESVTGASPSRPCPHDDDEDRLLLLLPSIMESRNLHLAFGKAEYPARRKRRPGTGPLPPPRRGRGPSGECKMPPKTPGGKRIHTAVAAGRFRDEADAPDRGQFFTFSGRSWTANSTTKENRGITLRESASDCEPSSVRQVQSSRDR